MDLPLDELPLDNSTVVIENDINDWGIRFFGFDDQVDPELRHQAERRGGEIRLPPEIGDPPEYQHAPLSSSQFIHRPSTPNGLENLLGPLVHYNQSHPSSVPLAEFNHPFTVPSGQTSGDPNYSYQQSPDQSYGTPFPTPLFNGVSYTMSPLPDYAPSHYFESASPIMVRWGTQPQYGVNVPMAPFNVFGNHEYLVPEPENKELSPIKYNPNNGYAEINQELPQPFQPGRSDAGESSTQGSHKKAKNEDKIPRQQRKLVGVKRPSFGEPKTLRTVTSAGFVCADCGLTFPNVIGLNKHYRTHMRIQVDKTGAGSSPLTNCHCPICPAVVTNPGSLKGHIAMHLCHPEELTPELTTAAEAQCPGRPLERCDQCPFVADRARIFLQHQQTHLEGSKVHRCVKCGVTLTSPHTAAQHQKLHKQGRFVAGEVGVWSLADVVPDAQDDEDFNAREGFTEIPTQGGSNNERAGYDCRVCGAKLTTRSFRRNHYAAHRQYSLETSPKEDNDFPCTVCGEKFTSNYLRNRHTKTHATGPSKENRNKRKRGEDGMGNQAPFSGDRGAEVDNFPAEPSSASNMSQPREASEHEGVYQQIGDIIDGPQQITQTGGAVPLPVRRKKPAKDLKGKGRAV